MQRVYCNVKPEGTEGPRAYVGYLTSIALSTLGNLTEVGDVCFFERGNSTKAHRPMCSSVHRPPLKDDWFFLYLFLYLYKKTLLLTTHFQYKLMELTTLWGLLKITTRFSSENQALEDGGYLTPYYMKFSRHF